MKYCRKVVLLWVVMVVGIALSCRKEPPQVGKAPEIEWMKVFDTEEDDRIYEIEETSDGSFIFIGEKSISFKDYMWIMKMNTSGDTLWNRIYEAEAYSIEQTRDGGYIISGFSIFLMKTDSKGAKKWQKKYELGDYAFYEGGGSHQTKDGGYIVAGTAVGSQRDFYLVKTDSLGNTEWQKVYSREGCTCFAQSCQQTIDGGYIITGSIWDMINGPTTCSLYLLKTDSLGATLWTKVIGDAKTYTYGLDIKQTADGGYVVVGSYAQKKKRSRIYLVKMNSAGEIQWSRKYLFGDSSSGASVHEDSDCGYIISGNAVVNEKNSLYVMKVNSDGMRIWTGFYGSGKYLKGGRGIPTSDGGYLIAGSTREEEIGQADAILIKLKPEK